MTTDPTANFHGGDEYSTAAHDSLPDKAQLRARLLAIIAAQGEHGATSDELEVRTGLSHQTVSARLTEMKQRGEVLPAGRRPTRSGRSAGVWVAAVDVARRSA